MSSASGDEATSLRREIVALADELTLTKGELAASHEQLTATSEVLQTITRFPSQTQPVLDAIVVAAARLCRASHATIFRSEEGRYHPAATSHSNPELVAYQRLHPIEPGRGTLVGRTAIERRIVHMPDALSDPEYSSYETQRLGRFRTMLGVPLLHGGELFGVIALVRTTVDPFSEKQIELIRTFADQAVIAIQNARLVGELHESLRQQTAASDMLKAISRTAFDLQMVLDTLVRAAAELCGAKQGILRRVEGEHYGLAATHGLNSDWRNLFARHRNTPGRGTLVGRVALEKRTVQIPDVFADPEFQNQETARAVGFRATIGTPLLRDGQPIGFISLLKETVGPFTGKQVQLLESFADQAVIAIENARLFEEVQARTRELTRSVEELRSLGKVGRIVGSSLDLSQVLQTAIEQASTMASAAGGAIYVFDGEMGEFRLEAAHDISAEAVARVRAQPLRLSDPVIGECGIRREAVQVADLKALPATTPQAAMLRNSLVQAGVRAVLAVPLLYQGDLIGALAVRRNEPGVFSPEIVRLLEAFAAQSAIAVRNARLFDEIAQKSRELEIASQHKSQFVANMSHELRTPLAAVLGYAELMQEGFYEPLGQKSLDALTRIRSNGKHLLGLINTVLDIAKIESGQFKLNLGEYALANVVETVCAATESLAETKKLLLKAEVARSMPIGFGDEQRLTQVLLNLVGNAIKFTDAGEVCLSAKAVNGRFLVSVTDTGPGIPEHEQARIFEQFHQVDSSLTRTKGGTGLGLAISKQIVEMHGGRIWVQSTQGKGAIFQIELPARARHDQQTA